MKPLYAVIILSQSGHYINAVDGFNLDEIQAEEKLRSYYTWLAHKNPSDDCSYCMFKQTKRINDFYEQHRYVRLAKDGLLPLSSLRVRYKNMPMIHIWLHSVCEDGYTLRTELFGCNYFLDSLIAKRVEIVNNLHMGACSSQFGALLTYSFVPLLSNDMAKPRYNLFQMPLDKQALIDTIERLSDPCNISLLLEQPLVG